MNKPREPIVIKSALSLMVLLLVAGLPAAWADEDKAKETPDKKSEPVLSVEDLAKESADSVVVITYFGRDGQEEGVGTGFVVSTNGWIATCLHVIGEARPIKVRLQSGEALEVTDILAWDRNLDLALLKVDSTKLVALPLGDSDELEQGVPVVAMGNPMGLEHSVVEGVVSARREFDQQDMLQLAIPIEPGNSGGPLLDRQGRVQGILNMKSALTRNLGFAIPVNQLKLLIEKPNPIPVSRWLTIGALNERLWKPLFGGKWRRKGDRIHVEGMGSGFGGRTLCLNQQAPPSRPFEITVSVKLDDESGAAGLVFGSDGQDRHYGFYPSAGNIRLTRFDGPNVFTWTILEQIDTPHYRPGDWNRLKVRWETNRIIGYVNDHKILDSPDNGLSGGRIGLAKFRDTVAQFRGFQFGTNLNAGLTQLTDDDRQRLMASLEGMDKEPTRKLVDAFKEHPEASHAIIRERSRNLARQMEQLEVLSRKIHLESIQDQMSSVFAAEEKDIDLFHAGLLIAKLDNPELNIQAYRDQIDEMALEIESNLDKKAAERDRLKALNRYLFEENGFHGSRTDYYHRANSYLNAVLDDREGIPITLSIVFMELASRVGLDSVVGIGLPGHFIVKHVARRGEDQLIDVFNNGLFISEEEAGELVLSHSGLAMREEHLEPATKKSIILRMLSNLLGIAESQEDFEAALQYTELMVHLDKEEPAHRLRRAMLRIQTKDRTGAKEDFKWILDHAPDGWNLDRIEEAYRAL